MQVVRAVSLFFILGDYNQVIGACFENLLAEDERLRPWERIKLLSGEEE